MMVKLYANNWFELEARHDRCNSFYKKAYTSYVYNEDGEMMGIVLKSYDTIVCYIGVYGTVHKLWDGYSVTTMRHINEFIAQHGNTNEGGKKYWESLPTYKEYLVLENLGFRLS